LFVSLPSELRGTTECDDPTIELYGFRKENWIEIKSFFAQRRRRKAKSDKLGEMVKDLIRLCLFAGQPRVGRYMILVLSASPEETLPLEGRDWLRELTSEGIREAEFRSINEGKTFFEGLGASNSEMDFAIQLKARVRAFEPDDHPFPLFHGYLIRILDFKIDVPGGSTQYEGGWKKREASWGPGFSHVRDYFIRKFTEKRTA
jgi:hypothetical protein